MNEQGKMVSVMMQLPETFVESEVLVSELKGIVEDLRSEYAQLKQSITPISFTERELADYFGISLITLGRIRRDGKISYTRVGGKIHYTRAHIEEFLTVTQTNRKGRKKTAG